MEQTQRGEKEMKDKIIIVLGILVIVLIFSLFANYLQYRSSGQVIDYRIGKIYDHSTTHFMYSDDCNFKTYDDADSYQNALHGMLSALSVYGDRIYYFEWQIIEVNNSFPYRLEYNVSVSGR